MFCITEIFRDRSDHKKDHNDPYAYYIRRCTAYLVAAGLQQDRSLCPGSSVKGDQNDEGRTRIAKSIATLVSLAVLFAIVSGLVSMLIPQIYESIIGFQDSLTEYINNLTVWISKLLQDNEHLQESIMPYYNEAVMRFQNWIATDLVPNISLIFDRVSSGVISLVTVLKNLLIGLIVMVYFLNIKDTLCAQSKKMV